jgi:WD40 repeat protein
MIPPNPKIEYTTSPYPGILPYNFAMSNVFSSREGEARKLDRSIVLYKGTLLYANSGVGKTSLVNAGLLPLAKEEGFQPERIRLQPKNDSEIIIERISENPEGQPPFLPSLFGKDEEHDRVALSVEKLLQTLHTKPKEVYPLLIFDQFEEWITLFDEGSTGEAAKEAKICQKKIENAITTILLDDNITVKVLIILREDYLARLEPLFKRCPNLPEHYIRLGYIKTNQIHQVIREPFYKYPGRFSPEISDAIADKIQKQFEERTQNTEIHLSEIQIVCYSLYVSRVNSNNLERYFDGMGGVQGILELYLEKMLNSLEYSHHGIAVNLLSRLVTRLGTRNIISEDDLISLVSLEDDIPREILRETLFSLEQKTKLIRLDHLRNMSYYEITSEFIIDWIQKKDRERKEITRQTKLEEANKSAEEQRLRAEEEAQKANKLRQLANDLFGLTALNHLDIDPERSVLFALLSAQRAYFENRKLTPQLENTLHRAIQASRVRLRLSGHEAQILSVAFSPDGNVLATAGGDSKIKVWDAYTGELRLDISTFVTKVAFSPDGTCLAIVAGRKLIMYDAMTGKIILELDSDNPLICLAFSKDGKLLATGDEKGILTFRDSVTGEIQREIEAHKDMIRDIAFTPDGTRIVTGSDDTIARLWNISTGEPMMSFSGHELEIYGVAISPDGMRLATVGRDRTARTWDISTGKQVMTFRGHTDTLTSVAFNTDGSRIATASYDWSAKLWDASSGVTILTLSGHFGSILSLDISADGSKLVTASEDQTVRVWDIAHGEEVLTLTLLNDLPQIAFSPDGLCLAASCDQNAVKIWDVRSGRVVHSLIGHIDEIYDIDFSHDGKRLVTCSNDMSAIVWDTQHGRYLFSIAGVSYSIVFKPDGSRLASAGRDGSVKEWDSTSGNLLQTFCEDSDKLYFKVVYSTDGTMLAACGQGPTFIVWNTETHHKILEKHGDNRRVRCIAFSPDQPQLATGGDSGKIIIWSLPTRKEVRVLTGHFGLISSLSYSPDGKYLASASWDRTVKLWDAQTGLEMFTFSCHTDLVSDLAFSPDSQLLATASADKTVRVFSLNSGELINLARRRVTRTLSREERDNYLPLEFNTPAIKALGLVVKGQEQALAGKVKEALINLRKACKMDPTLDIDPHREACLLAANALVARGKKWIELGDISKAFECFRQACDFDSTLNINPESEVAQLAKSILITKGQVFALAGNVPDAIECYQKACSQDANLDLDPQLEAKRLSATGFLIRGVKLGNEGNFSEALQAYKQAQTLNPNYIPPPIILNEYCWYGSLLGHAAEVLWAGDMAVTSTHIAQFNDTRGLARAITGDYKGAIQDFTKYIDSAKKFKETRERIAKRETWIEELESGRNPFDEKTLETLLQESGSSRF